MLIYVDKKREKRRKIKIFCIFSSIIICIGLNLFYYCYYLNHGKAKLINYKTVKYQNDWFNNAQPVQVFSGKQNPFINIIIIPSTINREIAITLAHAFANLPIQNYNLTFIDETNNENFIRQIATTSLPQAAPEHPVSEIILTQDISKVTEQISNNRLYPKTYNYTKAMQMTNIPLNNLLGQYYPPKPEPQSKIEKEQQALNNFAKENKKELIEFIFQNKSPRYSKQSTFLKSVRLCLQNNITTSCQMHANTSLSLNIKKALKTFPKGTKLQKLLLLSSNEKISAQNTPQLKDNEGLYFRFNQRNAYLLPHEISIILTKQKEPLHILKEKIGLNPEYFSPKMELYKFNVTEVNLDEEI